MTPKAVFWDMDGTLVDSEPLHAASLAAAMRSEGLVPPANLHERALGQTAAHIFAMMRDEFGLALPFPDWIERKYNHYLADLSGLGPRPGAVEIFRDLKALGIPQAIVSNSDRMVVDANLNAVGLAYPGMKTVSRNDVREGKPHAEPFLRAAWLVGVEPADAAVVEDSVIGATAGLAAGMKTIFWPEQAGMQGPDGAAAVNSAAELRAVLGLG